jgi:hypothetical protein
MAKSKNKPSNTNKFDEGAILDGSAIKSAAPRPKEDKKERQPWEPVIDDKNAASQPSTVTTSIVLPEKPKKNGFNFVSGIVFGIILIFIGTLLLLNNFHILPWSLWLHVWKFWPVFLILVGVQVIVGKSKIASIIVATLSILFVLALMYAVMFTYYIPFQDWVKNNVSGFDISGLGLFKETPREEKTLTVSSNDYPDANKLIYVMEVTAGAATISDSENTDIINVFAKYNPSNQDPTLDPAGNLLLLQYPLMHPSMKSTLISQISPLT